MTSHRTLGPGGAAATKAVDDLHITASLCQALDLALDGLNTPEAAPLQNLVQLITERIECTRAGLSSSIYESWSGEAPK